MFLTVFLILVSAWLILVAALFISLFLFSLWWVRSIDRRSSPEAMKHNPIYRGFLAAALFLLAPVYVPIQYVRTWQRKRHWYRMTRHLSPGIIHQQWEGGKLMVYANLDVLPDLEQKAFWDRLEGGECPEEVFADIEQRFAQYRETGR